MDGSVAQSRVGVGPPPDAVRVERGRFHYELAGPADDAELRRLLSRTVMPGQVQITLRREPSYFAAARVDGPFHQVVVARDSTKGGIAAMGSRSIRNRIINGRPTPVGYLSNLRFLPEYRGGTILARGYAFFKELDRDGAAPFYLTTISATNDVAVSALTARRAGLPTYHFLGRYYTEAIPLVRRPRSVIRRNEVAVRSAHAEERDLLLEVLRCGGRRYQFFPSYEPADLFCDTETFVGLQPADVLIASRAGRPVGVLGCWDQSRYRQTIVEGYGAPLCYLRRWYNLWARLRGSPRLPPPGSPLRCLTAAFPLAIDGDASVFAALIHEAQRRYGGQDYDVLLVGMYESDPLLPIVRSYSTFTYVTNVYRVSWQDQLPALGAAPVYLELGCL